MMKAHYSRAESGSVYEDFRSSSLGGVDGKWIWIVIACVLLVTTPTSIHAANLTAEATLYTSVFTNYQKNIRPWGDNGHAVNVELHIAIHQVSYLKAEEQALQTLLVITAKWQDLNLGWVPADHSGIQFMILPASDFWLPDFGISNSAKSFYDDESDDFRLQLKYTGDITWSFGGHVTTKCSVQVETFPFDQQSCEFTVSNWMYDVNAVNLTLKYPYLDMDEFVKNVEWDLVDTHCKYEALVHTDRDSRTYPSVTCEIAIVRKPMYYVTNMFIPAYLVLILFLVAFWLPPGHRAVVPLQMTTLLIFSVMLLNVAKHLPRTSHIPHISTFALLIIVMATVSVIFTVIISVMRIYMDFTYRAPALTIKIACQYLAPILCLKTIAEDVKNKTIPEEDVNAVEPISKEANDGVRIEQLESDIGDKKSHELLLLATLVKISEDTNRQIAASSAPPKPNKKQAMIRAEWDLLSRITARLAFWLITIMILGLTIEFVITVVTHSVPPTINKTSYV